MEGWRDGRDGGMEGWRDGGMEGWRMDLVVSNPPYFFYFFNIFFEIGFLGKR
jgi:hypothetical protein